MRRLLVCCLLLPALCAGEIYQSRDAEGRIIYSDRPVEGAEPVQLPRTNTTPAAETAPQTADKPAKAKAFTGYQLTILQPANNSIIPNGLAPPTAQVTIQPALREGDAIRLLLDGSVIATQASTHFPLPQLSRGSHSLQAEAVSEDGDSWGTSAVHQFFVYLPGAR